MAIIKNIKITQTEGMSEAQAIDQRLKALILTTEGTMPGNRAFGLSPGITDSPIDQIANILVVDLSDKAEIYVPEIAVMGVQVSIGDKGVINTEIEIKRREE